MSDGDSWPFLAFLSKDGQLLLPFLELICNTERAVDELIDVVGKAAIEAVILLSAQQIAGPKQPGKVKADVGWHGRQQGVVSLSERKLCVEKPRLIFFISSKTRSQKQHQEDYQYENHQYQ